LDQYSSTASTFAFACDIILDRSFIHISHLVFDSSSYHLEHLVLPSFLHQLVPAFRPLDLQLHRQIAHLASSTLIELRSIAVTLHRPYFEF
jgi:hypothetical protein